MLEADILRLNARERVNLENLEDDIRVRERRILARRATTRRIASCQALVLLVAVAGSGTAGAAMATHVAPPSTFVAEESLTPSNLLLGKH
jgi:hypothetical protein